MPPSIHNKPPPYDLTNFSVLMVEDSEYMQHLISDVLKIFGVGDILMCGNAKEATDLITIAQARTTSRYVNKIDIIITDWLMPEGSGHELLQWIRTHENDLIKFLPIIVVSGYTTEKITNETRDLGANEILVKPISGNTLAQRICSVIDNPRPFVNAQSYFGPDRRRQQTPYMGDDRRIQTAKIVEVAR